jgi:hypothetical protein
VDVLQPGPAPIRGGDERAGATAAAKTLGELPALMQDLVPVTPVRRDDLALATPEDLRARGVQHWESARRSAFTGMLVPSLICWAIWVYSDSRFPWPLFVTFFTAMNLVRVLTHKQDIVAEEVRRLEKKQRKALDSPRKDERTDG